MSEMDMAPSGSIENNIKSISHKATRPPAKLYWFGTWNNYEEEKVAPFFELLGEKCKKYMCQEEIGKDNGTPHLQIKIHLYTKGRPIELFGGITKSIWWRGNPVWKGWDYCAKENTRAGRQWHKGCKPPPVLKVCEPYGWQLEVLEIIKQEPDKRTIHWFWEGVGHVGKSDLARYLAVKHDALIVDGKAGDMKYQIAEMDEKPSIVIVDIPKERGNNVSYNGIEQIKNGCFASTKFKCKMVLFNHPHIIVFANEPPNIDSMSADRWHIVKIDTIQNKD